MTSNINVALHRLEVHGPRPFERLAQRRQVLRRRPAARRCTPSSAATPPSCASSPQRWGWQHHTTDWRAAVTVRRRRARRHRHTRTTSTPSRRSPRSRPASTSPARSRSPARSPTPRRWPTAAAAAPGTTFVWFNYRRVPAVALAHRLVAAGALGRIYHVRAAYLQSWGGPDTPLLWRFQGDIAGSGAHGDLNAHIIDSVRFVTGEEIVTVEGAIEHTFITERAVLEGRTRRRDRRRRRRHGRDARRASTVDDAVLFLARLSGGGLASFEATRLATGYHNANRFEIHGERGALRFDFERMNELEFYDLSDDASRAGLDDDRRHPRRRRPSVRRRLVARQPRARLRAQLRQPGERHPDRHRRRRPGRAAARLRRRAGHPARPARGHRVGPRTGRPSRSPTSRLRTPKGGDHR